MLIIRRSEGKEKQCTSNILPCRINHNGPVDATDRYWKPEHEDDGTSTSYFRGRKLRGKTVPIPAGCQGVVLQKTIGSMALSQRSHTKDYSLQLNSEEEEKGNDAEDEDEDPAHIEVLQEVACFGEVTTWGHEVIPSGADDPYAKAMEEWTTFADKIHSYEKREEIDKLGGKRSALLKAL